jgi:Ca-activated chloride channel family protein
MRKSPILIAVFAMAIAGIAGFRLYSQTPQAPPTIKVDVDLVLVNATVTDKKGRYVTGLRQDQFEVFEDKVHQDIQYFSQADAPLSSGIVLDASGSMQENLEISHEAAVTFLNNGSPQDEYFLVEFNDRPHVTIDFTSDISKLKNHLLFVPAKGTTALYDGLYAGMEKVKQGVNPKKALILITDGGENNSRYTLGNVRDFAREKDVQLFVVGMRANILDDLAEMTGGRSFNVTKADMDDVCQKIAVELKNQYLVGYRPTNTSRNGLLRKIQVKVKAPPTLSGLTVRARTGYYAAADQPLPKP